MPCCLSEQTNSCSSQGFVENGIDDILSNVQISSYFMYQKEHGRDYEHSEKENSCSSGLEDLKLYEISPYNYEECQTPTFTLNQNVVFNMHVESDLLTMKILSKCRMANTTADVQMHNVNGSDNAQLIFMSYNLPSKSTSSYFTFETFPSSRIRRSIVSSILVNRCLKSSYRFDALGEISAETNYLLFNKCSHLTWLNLYNVKIFDLDWLIKADRVYGYTWVVFYFEKTQFENLDYAELGPVISKFCASLNNAKMFPKFQHFNMYNLGALSQIMIKVLTLNNCKFSTIS